MNRLIFISLLAIFLTACGKQVTEFAASNPKIATHVGVRNATGDLQTSGKAGFLVFGPYIEITPGTYRLVAKGKLSGEIKPLAVIDVIAHKGEKTFVSRPIYGDDPVVEGVIGAIIFEVPRAVSDAEFRIQVQEQTVGAFNGYELTRIVTK